LKGRDVYIAGIGSYSPGNPIPFDQIEEVLGKITDAPQRILRRINRLRVIMKEMLGIEYAYYALEPTTRQPTETNVSMAVKSAERALRSAGMEAKEIDLIIYAGVLFDCGCPPSSTLVQDALNIPYCAEMAIHSNCTSIYKALQVASDLIAYGRYHNALLVTSQISSAFLRAEYFNQKVLTEEQVILRWFLCDGAGALVLTSKKPENPCLKVVDTYLDSVGVGIEPSMRMLVGATHWNIKEIYEHGWHHLVQDMKVVSNLGPRFFERGINTMLEKTRFDVSKVKCFFANLPTKYFMDITVKILKKNWKYDFPFYTKLSTRGYQGAPAIVIGLDEYMNETKLNPGDLLVSFVTESSKWMHAGFILEYC
jgi:3-oxoacyl-[acyl-carrier-protein] synthase-3